MSATQSNNLPLWVQDRDQVIAESTDVQWRYQTPPDYSRSKENLAKESTLNHLEGTLEAIVQNLVRTFEMEVSFKTNPQQWLSIVNDKFRVSTNGGTSTQQQIWQHKVLTIYLWLIPNITKLQKKALNHQQNSSTQPFLKDFLGKYWKCSQGHQMSHLSGGTGDILTVHIKDYAPTERNSGNYRHEHCQRHR